VSGNFYGDVLATRVFKPIGMTTARVIDEADIVPNRAAGYRLEKGELKNQEWVAPRMNTTADGSLYFSARDLVAWDTAVRTRAIHKPESWERILKPVRLTSGKTYPYGFGWSIDERGEQPMHSHGGSWQGFKTQFSRFIGDDLSIIVLDNLAQANPERFADGIDAIVNERLAVPALRPTEDKETAVTARLEALLQRAREGTLAPSEFAYIRAGFFPEGAKAYQERLRELGPAGKLILVRRNDLGDDRVYTYEIAFGPRAMYYTVALAPDGKIAQFSLREKTN
jgi:CubicO group peptidase (beta-lactamase class C family)